MTAPSGPQPTPCPPVPRIIRIAVVALCAALLASAVVGAAAAATNRPAAGLVKPAWFTLAFEIIIAIASGLGVLTGLGRFRTAPALAIGLAGAVVSVGSLLGAMGAGWQLWAVNLAPFLIARELAAALLAALAIAVVAVRKPSYAAPRLFIGGGVAALAPAAGWAAWAARGWIGSQHGLVQAALVVLLFLVVTALLATGVQLIADALASGRIDESGAAGGPDARTSSG